MRLLVERFLSIINYILIIQVLHQCSIVAECLVLLLPSYFWRWLMVSIHTTTRIDLTQFQVDMVVEYTSSTQVSIMVKSSSWPELEANIPRSNIKYLYQSASTSTVLLLSLVPLLFQVTK